MSAPPNPERQAANEIGANQQLNQQKVQIDMNDTTEENKPLKENETKSDPQHIYGVDPHTGDITVLSTERVVSYVEFHKNNSRISFCCGGHLQYGPELGGNFCTWLLILVPVGLHSYFVFLSDCYLELICNLCFFTFTALALLFTTFSDPGYLPRGDPPSNARLPSRNATQNRYKWCNTCKIWRPPRAKHCRICDACVRTMDHHCPWVGNCVAERNMIYFMCFVFSIIPLIISTMVTGVVCSSGSAGWAQYVFYGVIGIMGLILAACSGRFLVAWCSGLTTAEYVKNRTANKSRSGTDHCMMYCSVHPSQITTNIWCCVADSSERIDVRTGSNVQNEDELDRTKAEDSKI